MKNVAVQVVVLVGAVMVGCLGLVLIANVWWQSPWSGASEVKPLWGWLALVVGLVGTGWGLGALARGSRASRTE